MVFGRQINEMRKSDGVDIGNPFGTIGGEALIIFDDVFVPYERVFMLGEVEFTGVLVERFASLHRQNYGGCKAGVADVICGACSLLAEFHGVRDSSHIRDKLTEIVHLTETMYSCSLACSYEGFKTSSGACLPDPLLANVTKLNVTRLTYEVSRLAHDIGGGIIATAPSEKDLKGEAGKWVEKFLKTGTGVSAIERLKLVRLIESLTLSGAIVESMHGAGSPQAQKVVILRQANLEERIESARKLAGI
jgi:4-hydroxybutyryl-CoA dehydratase/vinylacetyl-CoA-Delta-isomerase